MPCAIRTIPHWLRGFSQGGGDASAGPRAMRLAGGSEKEDAARDTCSVVFIRFCLVNPQYRNGAGRGVRRDPQFGFPLRLNRNPNLHECLVYLLFAVTPGHWSVRNGDAGKPAPLTRVHSGLSAHA